MSLHEAADRMFQPTADELRPRTDAGTEVVARDDLLLAIGPLAQQPWSSQVYWTRWAADQVEAGIDDVLAIFRTRRQAFVWLVTDKSTPTSLRDRLIARDFITELEGRILVASLPILGLRVNRELRIEEATDRSRMEDALRVEHPSWDAGRAGPSIEDRMRRLGADWHAAVGYLDGHAVGTARWRVHSDLRAVELNGAETLPGYRRRGVYSSLVAYRTERAAKDGCTVAAIIADVRTSAPILLRRGFEDVGRATFFLWPASRFEPTGPRTTLPRAS